MSKRFVPFVALAVAFSPATFADTQEVQVEIEYDSTLLADDASAETVMESVKSQARKACSYNTSITHIPSVDSKCTADVVTKAINAIVAERHAAGLETAEIFENRATITLAALDQG